MACDTFIKIAQKCRRHFVMLQAHETEPFVEEILRNLPRTTVDLSPQQVCHLFFLLSLSITKCLQVHTFYEAVGWMISAQPNKAQQEKLIFKLMELPNSAVSALIYRAAKGLILSFILVGCADGSGFTKC
jgi:exportin-1